MLPCARLSTCPSHFHAECLLAWLERQLTCPLCRRSFEGELGGGDGMHLDAEQLASAASMPSLAGLGGHAHLAGPVRDHRGGSEARADAEDSLGLGLSGGPTGGRWRASGGGGGAPEDAFARTDGWRGGLRSRQQSAAWPLLDSPSPNSASTHARSATLASPAAATQRSARPAAHRQPPRQRMTPPATSSTSFYSSASAAGRRSPNAPGRPGTSDLPGGVRLFTPVERLDLDTRRTLQQRVAALHQQRRR